MRSLWRCQAGGGDLQALKLVKGISPQHLFGAAEHRVGVTIPKMPRHVLVAMAASLGMAANSPARLLEHICPSLPSRK